MATQEHRVLVIDDDWAIRETVGEVLHDAGYQVVCASNGREALDYLRQGPVPCMILLDLMMPVMDGHQFREHQDLCLSILTHVFKGLFIAPRTDVDHPIRSDMPHHMGVYKRVHVESNSPPMRSLSFQGPECLVSQTPILP